MRLPALILATGLLAGCASAWNALDFAPGTPQSEVTARAGRPTRVVPLPNGGRRLQYSMQPFGQYAFDVDFDAGGRLLQSRQVLTLNNFNRIEPGQWTRQDILDEFGPPATVDGVASWNGPIWTYRWNDGSDMFYWVYFDNQGIVRRAHQGMEFHNDPPDRP